MKKNDHQPNTYPELGLVIAGNKIGREKRDTLDVFDPSTGDVLGQLPLVNESDMDLAITQAWDGFLLWKNTDPYTRADILKRTAELMLQNRESLAELITYELGKPYYTEALAEIDQSAGMFEWYAEEGKRSYGRQIPSRDGATQLVCLEPVGPIAGFGSWNAPTITPARKIAGALAAGCSMIYRGSEETPASILAIADFLEEAGLPRGVLSVVFGDPIMISEKLLTSPIIRGVTFTGSTKIGRQLASKAVFHMKRPIFELGGHAPVIICEDIDLDKIVQEAVTAKFRNSGQICTCPTRFLIHQNIHDEFAQKFSVLADNIVVGNGFDHSTEMGPLANTRQIASMEKFVKDAHQRGVNISAGGERCDNQNGYYFKPTVFSNTSIDILAHNDEPFGPLAITTSFSTIEEALKIANRLPWGLASYAFTNNLKKANQIANTIDAGNVIINNWRVSYPETPFGGVKDSGLGCEGAIEGLRVFQNVKFIRQA